MKKAGEWTFCIFTFAKRPWESNAWLYGRICKQWRGWYQTAAWHIFVLSATTRLHSLTRKRHSIFIAQSDNNPHMYESYMTFAQMKPMQDYLVHRVLRYAEEKNLPVQIHTGLQEGSGNFIRNSDPTLLTNLFYRISKSPVDLFHGQLSVFALACSPCEKFP